MTRKEFLQLSIGGAGVALAAACGGSYSMQPAPSSGPGPSSSGNCLQYGSTSQIAANHGHVLVVTKADIAAGMAKTYDIRGTADHTHQVTLSAADMAALQQNMQAQETSTTDLGHSHGITVMCV